MQSKLFSITSWPSYMRQTCSSQLHQNMMWSMVVWVFVCVCVWLFVCDWTSVLCVCSCQYVALIVWTCIDMRETNERGNIQQQQQPTTTEKQRINKQRTHKSYNMGLHVSISFSLLPKSIDTPNTDINEWLTTSTFFFVLLFLLSIKQIPSKRRSTHKKNTTEQDKKEKREASATNSLHISHKIPMTTWNWSSTTQRIKWFVSWLDQIVIHNHTYSHFSL